MSGGGALGAAAAAAALPPIVALSRTWSPLTLPVGDALEDKLAQSENISAGRLPACALPHRMYQSHQSTS